MKEEVPQLKSSEVKTESETESEISGGGSGNEISNGKAKPELHGNKR